MFPWKSYPGRETDLRDRGWDVGADICSSRSPLKIWNLMGGTFRSRVYLAWEGSKGGRNIYVWSRAKQSSLSQSCIHGKLSTKHLPGKESKTKSYGKTSKGNFPFYSWDNGLLHLCRKCSLTQHAFLVSGLQGRWEVRLILIKKWWAKKVQLLWIIPGWLWFLHLFCLWVQAQKHTIHWGWAVLYYLPPQKA